MLWQSETNEILGKKKWLLFNFAFLYSPGTLNWEQKSTTFLFPVIKRHILFQQQGIPAVEKDQTGATDDPAGRGLK